MPLSAPSCSVLLACWNFSSHSYAYQHLLTYFRQKESGQLKHYKYYLCLNPPCFDWGRLGSAQTNTKGGTSDLQQTGRQAVSNGSDFGNRYSHRLVLLSRATLRRPVLLWAKKDFFYYFWKKAKWYLKHSEHQICSIPNPEEHIKTCFLYFTVLSLCNSL